MASDGGGDKKFVYAQSLQLKDRPSDVAALHLGRTVLWAERYRR